MAWFSAAVGFVGRVGPTILAIGVGGGVLFFLWKIRKRFFSLVRDFILVDREDGDTTDNRRVYQTLLRSMCCVMAAINSSAENISKLRLVMRSGISTRQSRKRFP